MRRLRVPQRGLQVLSQSSASLLCRFKCAFLYELLDDVQHGEVGYSQVGRYVGGVCPTLLPDVSNDLSLNLGFRNVPCFNDGDLAQLASNGVPDELSLPTVHASGSIDRLDQKVDLYELGKLREFLHDPDIYCGMVAYHRSPSTQGTVSVFTSGKMIIVGAKSEEEASHGLEYAKDFLVERGVVKPTILKHKIQNIVAVADLKTNIDLEKIAERKKRALFTHLEKVSALPKDKTQANAKCRCLAAHSIFRSMN